MMKERAETQMGDTEYFLSSRWGIARSPRVLQHFKLVVLCANSATHLIVSTDRNCIGPTLAYIACAAATPGYFSTTLISGIQIEATSTRRAGLIRFTFPAFTEPTTNHIVVDLIDDLQRSFQGGSISISPSARVTLSGTFLQASFTIRYLSNHIE